MRFTRMSEWVGTVEPTFSDASVRPSPALDLWSVTPGDGRRFGSWPSRDGRPETSLGHFEHPTRGGDPTPTTYRGSARMPARADTARSPAGVHLGGETHHDPTTTHAPCLRHGTHRGGDPDGGSGHRRERRRRGPTSHLFVRLARRDLADQAAHPMRRAPLECPGKPGPRGRGRAMRVRSPTAGLQ